MKLLIYLMLSFCLYLGLAQNRLNKKQFLKSHPECVLIPADDGVLYLYRGDSGWGLYDATDRIELVPSNYDAIFPTLVDNLYYIIKNDVTGLFDAASMQEVLSPQQYDNLTIGINTGGSKGDTLVQYERRIEKQNGNSVTIRFEHETFKLSPSVEGFQLDPIQTGYLHSDPFRIDKIERIDSQIWVHQHGLTTLNEWDSSGYKIVQTGNQSGVFSISSHKYLIAPEYHEIEVRKNHIRVWKYPEPLGKLIAGDIRMEGLFSRDYREIFPPSSGSKDYIAGLGYYSRNNMNDELTVVDEQRKKLFSVQPFKGDIYTIQRWRNKYYISCYAEDELDFEMHVFDQYVYDEAGRLLHQDHFGLGESLVDREYVVVYNRAEESTTDLRYGLYHLQSDSLIIPCQYLSFDSRYFKYTLADQKDQTCSFYYRARSEEDTLRLDCYGQPVEVRSPDVSGIQMEISLLAEPLEISVPFEPTHQLYNTENEWDYFGTFESEWVLSPFDQYNDLTIYVCFNIYSEDLAYGLGHTGNENLILGPYFESIRFNHEKSQLELGFENQNYTFPLSRYK